MVFRRTVIRACLALPLVLASAALPPGAQGAQEPAETDGAASFGSLTVRDRVARVAYPGIDGLPADVPQGAAPRFCPGGGSGEPTVEVDGVTFSADLRTLVAYPITKRDIDYSIPDGTRYIADAAFAGNAYLEAVEFPMTLAAIGDGAFEGCTALVEADIPDSVQTIGARAFADCPALTRVVLADGYVAMGPGAFADCPDMGPAIMRPR